MYSDTISQGCEAMTTDAGSGLYFSRERGDLSYSQQPQHFLLGSCKWRITQLAHALSARKLLKYGPLTLRRNECRAKQDGLENNC